jgi:hypothetical protein
MMKLIQIYIIQYVTTENWYTYVPKCACTVWNQAVRREVLPNRADVIIENKKDNYVAVTPDRNLTERQAGKKLKIGT